MLKINLEKIYTQSELIENVRAQGKVIFTACPGLSERDIATVMAAALGEDVEFIQGRLGSRMRQGG